MLAAIQPQYNMASFGFIVVLQLNYTASRHILHPFSWVPKMYCNPTIVLYLPCRLLFTFYKFLV